jgi:hypothetical protein
LSTGSQAAPANPWSQTQSELLAEPGGDTRWAGDDGHGVGAVAAGGQKVLARHWRQGCWPGSSLYVPGAQVVHSFWSKVKPGLQRQYEMFWDDSGDTILAGHHDGAVEAGGQ